MEVRNFKLLIMKKLNQFWNWICIDEGRAAIFTIIVVALIIIVALSY